VLARANASNCSAKLSCGLDLDGVGLNSRPRDSTNARAKLSQSKPGYAAT